MKNSRANTMMEICQKTEADVDDVTAAISMATDRIISPRYLRGGMGDAGGCHPRDNIAMSWLAEELGLSCNPFEDMMRAREKQTRWLATLIDLPVGVAALRRGDDGFIVRYLGVLGDRGNRAPSCKHRKRGEHANGLRTTMDKYVHNGKFPLAAAQHSKTIA